MSDIRTKQTNVVLNEDEQAIFAESARIVDAINVLSSGVPFTEAVKILDGPLPPADRSNPIRPELLPIAERADLLWDIHLEND